MVVVSVCASCCVCQCSCVCVCVGVCEVRSRFLKIDYLLLFLQTVFSPSQIFLFLFFSKILVLPFWLPCLSWHSQLHILFSWTTTLHHRPFFSALIFLIVIWFLLFFLTHISVFLFVSFELQKLWSTTCNGWIHFSVGYTTLRERESAQSACFVSCVSWLFWKEKKGSSLDRPEKHNKRKEMRKKGLSRRLVPTPDGK